MTAFIPAMLVKVTLIFAAGLLVAVAMRRASASIRHLVLLATLVCGVTLPALMLISPSWKVGVLPQSASGITAATIRGELPLATAVTTSTPTSGGDKNDIARTSPDGVSKTATQLSLPVLIWVTGFLGILAWLAVGRLRLRKIAREAWPLARAEWQTLLDAVSVEAGVTREVRLFTSSFVSTPLTWGTLRPIILLPEDALDWSDDHRRVVLRHEMAHVSRGDSLSQLIAGFVCAIYWFHPLVWILERRV